MENLDVILAAASGLVFLVLRTRARLRWTSLLVALAASVAVIVLSSTPYAEQVTRGAVVVLSVAVIGGVLALAASVALAGGRAAPPAGMPVAGTAQPRRLPGRAVRKAA